MIQLAASFPGAPGIYASCKLSVPAASFQKSPFAPLLIDGNWQLHLFPDESLILHSQESAKKMLDCFGLFMMSALKSKGEIDAKGLIL